MAAKIDDKSKQGNTVPESRRGFLKSGGALMGLAAFPAGVSMTHVIEAKAAVQKDGKLIEKAAKIVEANAMRNQKGKNISVLAQYKKLGGKSKDVLAVLENIDKRMLKKGIDGRNVDNAISQGILDGIKRDKGGVAAAKGSKLYGVRDSAARQMFDRGGVRMSSYMTRQGHKISGYNAVKMQKMQAPSRKLQQMKMPAGQMKAPIK